MIGLMIPSTFAEIYEDNTLGFSIEISDSWYVDEETNTSISFGGMSGSLGEIYYFVEFQKDVYKEAYQPAVNYLRTIMNNYCSANYCEHLTELPAKNGGVVTIDGKKAYQIEYYWQMDPEWLEDDDISCSSNLTSITDENGSWALYGLACGKAHSSLVSTIKDSTNSFHSFNVVTSQPSSESSSQPSSESSSQPSSESTYVYPTTQIPSATKLYKDTNFKFSINYPEGWLVEEYSDGVSLTDIQSGNNAFWFEYYKDGVYYSDYSDSKKLNEIIKYEKKVCNESTFAIEGNECKNFEEGFSQITKITDNYSVFNLGYSYEATYSDYTSSDIAVVLTEHHIGNEIWVIESYTYMDVFNEYDDLIGEMHLSFKAFPSPIKYDAPSVPTTPSTSIVPQWIKNNAGWWAEGQISDRTFLNGIEFMIKENIISIPNLPDVSSDNAGSIPQWIKTNAGWWSVDNISDRTFLNGIEFLVKVGIIQVG